MIHHVDFDAKQSEAYRAEVFHQTKDLELYSNTQASKPNAERAFLYQKVQDIHNYKAEYELKYEAEAALETDLYRLGQLDGGKRALVAAVLVSCSASQFFTQDLEGLIFAYMQRKRVIFRNHYRGGE